MGTELLTNYMDQAIEQLRKATEKELEGKYQEAKSIEQEWQGVSALNLLTINVDTFVRQC